MTRPAQSDQTSTERTGSVQRMRPHLGEDNEVKWAGWSRMSTPIVSFTIIEVRKPNVGEVKPSAVTAELVFDTRNMRYEVRTLHYLFSTCRDEAIGRLGA